MDSGDGNKDGERGCRRLEWCEFEVFFMSEVDAADKKWMTLCFFFCYHIYNALLTTSPTVPYTYHGIWETMMGMQRRHRKRERWVVAGEASTWVARVSAAAMIDRGLD